MSARRTMDDELDFWLEVRDAKFRFGRGHPIMGRATLKDESDVPPCPLSEAELDWLWPRYQRCSFPAYTFARSIAGTARDRLTPRGKNAGVKQAYRYRRQIFGAVAVKWDLTRFLEAVRRAASFSAGEPKHAARETVSSASTAPVSSGEECPGTNHTTSAPALGTCDRADSFSAPVGVGAGANAP